MRMTFNALYGVRRAHFQRICFRGPYCAWACMKVRYALEKMYEPWPQPYAFGCLHAIKLCRRNIQQVMSRLLIEKAKGNRTVWVQKIVRILCDSQSPPWHLNQSTNSGLARGGLIKGRAGSAVRTQFSKTFYWTFSNLNFEIFLISFTIYFSLFFVSFPLNQP